MKIAICGASLPPFDESVLGNSYEIGREIAKKGCTLRFGGCWGYPYEAAKGCFENQGKVLAVSPAKNKLEHTTKYKFPTQNFTNITYTGLGIPGRNLPLVMESDAVIIISGQIGTLNEFTIAFHQKKAVGILQQSGGITSIAKDIVKICKKVGEKDIVVYEKEPKLLVSKLVELNQ